MKEKVLLDTNMLIYLLDDNVLDVAITKITKLLYDSNDYTIVVHPQTFKEAEKIKDIRRREIFKSKLCVYNTIDNPPKLTKKFNELAGAKNSHDIIDNELLYALERNCVSYLISNDKKLIKKGERLGLGKRTLSIKEAIDKFQKEEECVINTPVFIMQENLYKMDLEDEFFKSLRNDYKGFDNWFTKKQLRGEKAYVTKDSNNKITSFLMLKEEGKDEDYFEFNDLLKPAKRLKVSTFKVMDTGKKIGECFIKIMINEAIKKNVDELYVTTFERQEALISLLQQYGFKYYTYKNTIKSDDTLEKELVFIKDMKDKSQYPYVKIDSQNFFIAPIIPKYHKLLFEEAEGEFQISIADTLGMNTSANAIKKAFISGSKIKMIKPGDVILFYASHDKKAITTLGIVEATWNKFESQKEIFNLVRKRTAYNEEELKQVTKLDSLVIMFKHCVTFKEPIKYSFLYENNIVKGAPQTILSISRQKFEKIVEAGNSKEMFE